MMWPQNVLPSLDPTVGFLSNRRAKRPAMRRDRTRIQLDWERFEPRTLLSTFTVTNTSDNGGVDPAVGAGTGTLRQAIVDANAGTDPAGATIVFNMDSSDPNHFYYQNDGIAGQVSRDLIAVTTVANDSMLADTDSDHPQSWWSIRPATNLPALTHRVTINGYSQAGTKLNDQAQGEDAILRIELNNSQMLTGGLGLNADGSTLRGLVVNRSPNTSCIGLGGAGDTLAGCLVGTDVSGTVAFGNAGGVFVAGSSATIGGTTPADRNVISGSDGGYPGVWLNSDALVAGNYIGTDAGGTRPLGNQVGLRVSGESNTIGGISVQARNLISGNGDGIVIDFNASQDVIQGNFIGTDVTGTWTLGNSDGIRAEGDGYLIGGTAPGAGNLISGNYIGMELFGFNPAAQIEGNLIGTDITGEAPLGNAFGIYLQSAGGGTIGGLNEVAADGTVHRTAGNVISGNGTGIGGTGPVVVQGNDIGTDVAGLLPISPGNGAGISIIGGGSMIGGTTPGARNIISG